MNFRGTIILAVVLGLLWGVWHFQDKIAAPTDEELEKPQLTEFKADDVASLEITAGGGKKVVISKEDGAWYVTAPYHGLASQTDVTSVLTQFSNMKADRIVSDSVAPAALKQYGLDKPKATFVAHLKGSKDAPAVVIGNRTPNDAGWYVRQPDKDRVVLGGNTLTFAVNKKPEDWRERAPLAFDAEKVDRVAVTGPRISLMANKDKDGKWTLEKPHKIGGDDAEIRKYLGAVKALQVRRFPADVTPKDARLKRIYVLKVWEKGDRDPHELIVGRRSAADKGYFAMRTGKAPEVIVLPDNVVKTLAVDAAQLADHHLFAFEVDKVEKAAVFQSQSGAATAEKKAGTWNWLQPVPQQDNMGKLTALAYSLKELKYMQPVTDEDERAKAAASLKKPYARFELSDAGGKRVAFLLVGGKAVGAGMRYVQGLEKKAIFVADGRFADDWKANIAALKKPAPSASATPAASASPATP